jgi:predicted nucleotidyltransferase
VSSSVLQKTSLTPEERRTLERFVEQLQAELGDDLRSVWLYGSRARGEPPREESDVDLIVVTPGGRRDQNRVIDILNGAADAEGANWVFFSTFVFTPEHIAQRREINSFFMQEVDRDKIVLAGDP